MNYIEIWCSLECTFALICVILWGLFVWFLQEKEIIGKKTSEEKQDRSFLGGYAEFWDNPEDDRWDKLEVKGE